MKCRLNRSRSQIIWHLSVPSPHQNSFKIMRIGILRHHSKIMYCLVVPVVHQLCHKLNMGRNYIGEIQSGVCFSRLYIVFKIACHSDKDKNDRMVKSHHTNRTSFCRLHWLRMILYWEINSHNVKLYGESGDAKMMCTLFGSFEHTPLWILAIEL